MDHMIDMADADPAVMRFRIEKEKEHKALRDKFAMAALPSVMQKKFLSNDEYAMVSYALADAMMKAREKSDGHC
jgi:hypothetical protein